MEAAAHPHDGSASVAAQGPPRRPISAPLDRSTIRFLVLGGAFVVAGGLIAAVNSAAPFERGSWLAAYLVLVGGAAQIGLGAGRLALGTGPRCRRAAAAEAALWSLGSLVVPAGSLLEAPGLVTVGSAALVAGLALFTTGSRTGSGRWLLPYRALIALMALGVVVGNVLAYAPPGG